VNLATNSLSACSLGFFEEWPGIICWRNSINKLEKAFREYSSRSSLMCFSDGDIIIESGATQLAIEDIHLYSYTIVSGPSLVVILGERGVYYPRLRPCCPSWLDNARVHGPTQIIVQWPKLGNKVSFVSDTDGRSPTRLRTDYVARTMHDSSSALK
jgi:hypothetical protein